MGFTLPAQEQALGEGPFAIHPLGQTVEAPLRGQARSALALELVRALGPNAFPLLEPDAQIERADQDRVGAPSDEVHLDPLLRVGPTRFMREGAWVEVGIQVAIQANQQIPIER